LNLALQVATLEQEAIVGAKSKPDKPVLLHALFLEGSIERFDPTVLNKPAFPGLSYHNLRVEEKAVGD